MNICSVLLWWIRMVLDNPGVFFGTIGFFAVWIVVLTVMVVRITAHYNALTKGASSYSLKDILELLLKKQEITRKDIASIKDDIADLTADGKLHLQRLGIVRFNPFLDTGGSQSFTLALLDGQNSGIIMTSLYARTGNRWYIKHVKNGRCEEVELSKEEEAAIRNAQEIG